MFLSRRLWRLISQLFFFLIVASVLLFIANSRQIIEINKYIPFDIFGTTAPSFFQPVSDLFIVDISFQNCFKMNSNNNQCGLPSALEGVLGDKAQWVRLSKDITLGSSWVKSQFMSYKKIKHESYEEYLKSQKQQDPTSTSIVDEVIIDIAVANPLIDSKIKGNEKLKFPEYIIKSMHEDVVYDDSTHANLVEQNNDNRVDAHPVDAEVEQLLELPKEEQKPKEEEQKEETPEEHRKDEERKKEQEDEQKDASEEDKQEKQKESELLKEAANEEEKEKEKEGKKLEESSKEDKDKNTKREVVTDIKELKRLLYIPTKEQVQESGWRYKSNGIWLRYGPHDEKTAVSAIDLLFGHEAVDPRPNWRLIKRPLKDVSNPSDLPVYLTFRRGPRIDYKKEYGKPLKMNDEDKFKILQVADMHFSTGYGKCRDPEPESSAKGCKADARTLEFLEKVLDFEKPDMVVLTGDQIFGDASPDSESSAFKVLYPFVKRKIPFAITLGNHDDEGSLKRKEIMGIYVDVPYSVAAVGPDDIDGYGNYVVTVEGKSSKGTALSLFFVDSHSYSKTPKVTPGYDWIKENQLIYLKMEADSIKDSVEKYRKSKKIPLSMAFFHIPLPEFRNMNQPYIGEFREGITAPRYNSGARDVFGEMGVQAISVGHDHCNDYCLQDTLRAESPEENKIWLCYGGGSGLGGYGGYNGYIRRMRVYEYDTSKGEIKTWKRTEAEPDKKIDEQILVTGGNVVNWK